MPDCRCDKQHERLDRLFVNDLSEVEQSELAAHLEMCPECCRRLDALAAQSGYWSDLRLLKEGDEFERRWDSEDIEPGPIHGEEFVMAAGLLEPPSEPGHLGRLGRYDIISVVGRGGMGVVFQARERSLDRLVAIKILTPGLASTAAARRRFAREAKAAAAVVNEHVVAIHAVDATPQNVPYLVMQYVAGKSLQEKIDHEEPPQVCEILRIGMQAAQALAAAHAQGLIHRDIKPANILLENGVERVKITDFGLARAVDDATMTQPGVVAGTPRYMAPEQARGDAIDHRADLFSLGSVLYALCTGRAPFLGSSSVATLKSVCEDTPPPIGVLNPDVPAWLVRIIARLHAKDAADRYASAGELADLLGRCLAHVQQPATVALPPELADRPRHGAKMRLAVAACVIIGVVGVLAGASAVGGPVVDYVATVLRLKTPEGTLVVETDDPNVAIKIDGNVLVVTGAGLKELQLPVGQHNVQAIKNGTTLRDELVTITRGGRKTLSVHRENDAQRPRAPTIDTFVVDPMGATASGRPTPRDFLYRSEDDLTVPPYPAILPANAYAVTKLRQKVAPARWPKAQFAWQSPKDDFGTQIAGPVDVLSGHSGEIRTVAFSPDGKTLASGTMAGLIFIWQITPTGVSDDVWLIRAHHGGVESVAFAPDGKTLASGGWDHRVKLWDLSRATSSITNLWYWEGTSPGARPVAFSPDGTRIALGSSDGIVTILSSDKGYAIRATPGLEQPVNGVRFSCDGKFVAIALGDGSTTTPGEVQIWDLSSRKERAKFGGWKRACKSVAFSPDGSLLAATSLDGNARLYDVASLEEKAVLQGGWGAMSGLAFRPDGKLLATGSAGGNVIVWDVATKQRRAILQQAHNEQSPVIAFSPDGRTLAVGGAGGSVELWDASEPANAR